MRKAKLGVNPGARATRLRGLGELGEILRNITQNAKTSMPDETEDSKIVHLQVFNSSLIVAS